MKRDYTNRGIRDTFIACSIKKFLGNLNIFKHLLLLYIATIMSHLEQCIFFLSSLSAIEIVSNSINARINQQSTFVASDNEDEGIIKTIQRLQ